MVYKHPGSYGAKTSAFSYVELTLMKVCLVTAELYFIDRSATGLSAAATSFLVGMERLDIINGDFLAGQYLAQGVEKYVPVDDLHVAVGLARVIDIVCAVAAPAAVNAPSPVYVADSQLGAMRAALGFAARNSFARVLCDLPSALEYHGRKAAFAVDPGLADSEPVRQFQSHTGCRR
jgi:hypothetical protein